MAFVVVTRLRLRDAQYRDEFFGAALAVMEQATHSEGNVAADVLADADDTFWTRTAWNDRAAMSRFLNSEPHFDTMSRIDEWCDEATFIDWEQATPDLPDWKTAYTRLVADGQVTFLAHPSESHATRMFPPPVEAG